jgi:hypothetical protein
MALVFPADSPEPQLERRMFNISPLYVPPLLLFVLRYAQSSYIDPL